MSLTVQGKVIETVEEGYLLNRDDWSEEVGEIMATRQAQQDHVTLT